MNPELKFHWGTSNERWPLVTNSSRPLGQFYYKEDQIWRLRQSRAKSMHPRTRIIHGGR
ncbi:hypothetical protein BYT27DRAFT_7198169 [Phlegmacium glaucopus]|nr:hypothetical protein BYT27DRAFT_7198169 [Phlegmacium glaucopus]